MDHGSPVRSPAGFFSLLLEISEEILGRLPRLLAIFFLNGGCFPSGFILGTNGTRPLFPGLLSILAHVGTSSSSQCMGSRVFTRLKNLLVFSEYGTLRQGYGLGGSGKVRWREERPHGAGLQQACCDIHIAHKGATPESISRLRGNA